MNKKIKNAVKVRNKIRKTEEKMRIVVHTNNIWFLVDRTAILIKH